MIRRLDRKDWPPLDPKVLNLTDEVGELDAGRAGWFGVKWTSRIANEAFLWYVPGPILRPRALIAMRDAIAQTDIRFWMTVDKKKAGLCRWAEFLGFVPAGDFDEANSLYRRK